MGFCGTNEPNCTTLQEGSGPVTYKADPDIAGLGVREFSVHQLSFSSVSCFSSLKPTNTLLLPRKLSLHDSASS